MLNILLLSLFLIEINSKLTLAEKKKIKLTKNCKYELLVRLENFDYELKKPEQLELNFKITFTENLIYNQESIQSNKWSVNRKVIKENFTITEKDNIKLDEINLNYNTKGRFFYQMSFNQIMNNFPIKEFLNLNKNRSNSFTEYVDLEVEEVSCDLDYKVPEIKEIRVKTDIKNYEGICGLFQKEKAKLNLYLEIEVDLFKKYHLNIGSDDILKKICSSDRNFFKFKTKEIHFLCREYSIRKHHFF